MLKEFMARTVQQKRTDAVLRVDLGWMQTSVKINVQDVAALNFGWEDGMAQPWESCQHIGLGCD
ncbi:protein of unknown function [Caballeronia sp. S22]